MKFLDYAKAAFFNHYNMLVFGTGIVFSFMAGGLNLSAVFGGIALFSALEIIYLTIIAANPRFQRIVDAELAVEAMKTAKEESDKKLAPIIDSLSCEDRERFYNLRSKCKSLQENLLMNASDGMSNITESQTSDVNKLLWAFLNILVSRNKVSEFVAKVSERDLTTEIKRQEGRLKDEKLQDDSKLCQDKRNAIEDMLRTAKKRLDNLIATRGNAEIFDLRLEQIESKLSALAEMAMNRHDTSGIAMSIDSIARDVEISEATINELRDTSGISLKFDTAPAIMSMDSPNMDEPRDRGSVLFRTRGGRGPRGY